MWTSHIIILQWCLVSLHKSNANTSLERCVWTSGRETWVVQASVHPVCQWELDTTILQSTKHILFFQTFERKNTSMQVRCHECPNNHGAYKFQIYEYLWLQSCFYLNREAGEPGSFQSQKVVFRHLHVRFCVFYSRHKNFKIFVIILYYYSFELLMSRKIHQYKIQCYPICITCIQTVNRQIITTCAWWLH